MGGAQETKVLGMAGVKTGVPTRNVWSLKIVTPERSGVLVID